MSAGRGLRVLVVDDHRDAADALAELLRIEGHEVCVAHHPARALVLARDFEPELAILDIGLPDMDGYELAARLHEQDRDCRCIALSGYGQDADPQRNAAAGFAAHLVKPVDLARLSRLLAGQ